MAIAIRGTAQGVFADSGNLAFNKPTGLVSTDVWLIGVSSDGELASATGPSGFTRIFNATANTGTGNPQSIQVWRRVCDGSEGATATVTLTSAEGAGGSVAYSGVDNTTPEDTVGTDGGGTGGNCTANAINPSTSNTKVLFFGGINENTGAARTYTPPASMSELVDKSSSTWSSIEIADMDWASGSTGAKTAVCSSTTTSDGNIGVLIALKAAGGAAAVTYPQLERFGVRGGFRGMGA